AGRVHTLSGAQQPAIREIVDDAGRAAQTEGAGHPISVADAAPCDDVTIGRGRAYQRPSTQWIDDVVQIDQPHDAVFEHDGVPARRIVRHGPRLPDGRV